MWRELILAHRPGVLLGDGVSDEQLEAATAELGCSIPIDYREMLREFDGAVDERYGYAVFFSVEQLVRENIEARESYAGVCMPLDSLLFFAPVGDGSYYALVAEPPRNAIFWWNHESDSRTEVAPNLKTFIPRWFDGTLGREPLPPLPWPTGT